MIIPGMSLITFLIYVQFLATPDVEFPKIPGVIDLQSVQIIAQCISTDNWNHSLWMQNTN